MLALFQGLGDHKEFEFSEAVASIRGQQGKNKKTNQNGMQIFGHNGLKGFKTKG